MRNIRIEEGGKGRSIPPKGLVRVVQEHSGAQGIGGSVVSLSRAIGPRMRDFLIAEAGHQDAGYWNQYELYREALKWDPDVATACDFIALSMTSSYRGIGIRQDDEEEEYEAQPDFLDRINEVLTTVGFASILNSLLYGLSVDGNSIFRIVRHEDTEEIMRVEMLPTSTMTILNRQAITNWTGSDTILDPDKLISEANIYIQNESAKTGLIEDIEPTAYPAEDILHFARNAEGHRTDDCLGRDTINIWGEPPIRSLMIYIKFKLLMWSDYVRWLRVSMPRTDIAIDVDQWLDTSRFAGADETRIRQAQEAASGVIKDFEESLYYIDQDPASPTRGKKIPIETDHAIIHSSRAKVSQVGGASSLPDISGGIEICDRKICSRLGVPLTLFGYEHISSYATGSVTSKFMAAFGLGLLRAVESTLRQFMRREFARNEWEYENEDMERLVITLDIVDPDQEKVKNETAIAKASEIASIVAAATTLWEKGIITHAEVRTMIRGKIDILNDLEVLPDEVDGFYQAPATPSPAEVMEGENTSTLLAREEEEIAAATRQVYEDNAKTFLGEVADEVEEGTLGVE